MFIPAAFGLHPDHYLTLLAFTVGELLTQFKKRAQNIYLYGEQPYLSEKSGLHQGHEVLKGFSIERHPITTSLKRQMLEHYPSQLSPERVRTLLELSYEYYWKLTPAQFDEFLYDCRHRTEASAFQGFNNEEWLEKTKLCFQGESRHFVNINTHSEKGEQVTWTLE